MHEGDDPRGGAVAQISLSGKMLVGGNAAAACGERRSPAAVLFGSGSVIHGLDDTVDHEGGPRSLSRLLEPALPHGR